MNLHFPRWLNFLNIKFTNLSNQAGNTAISYSAVVHAAASVAAAVAAVPIVSAAVASSSSITATVAASLYRVKDQLQVLRPSLQVQTLLMKL